MLPNKFFDFVQARIGLVFSPAVETDRLIREHGIGVVARGFSAHDMADAIRTIDRGDLVRIKNAADRASRVLSSERDVQEQVDILVRLTKAAK